MASLWSWLSYCDENYISALSIAFTLNTYGAVVSKEMRINARNIRIQIKKIAETNCSKMVQDLEEITNLGDTDECKKESCEISELIKYLNRKSKSIKKEMNHWACVIIGMMYVAAAMSLLCILFGWYHRIWAFLLLFMFPLAISVMKLISRYKKWRVEHKVKVRENAIGKLKDSSLQKQAEQSVSLETISQQIKDLQEGL